MINWLALSYDDVVVLSILAYDHGVPLCDLVRNLHLLDEQERRIAETIIECVIDEKPDKNAVLPSTVPPVKTV